MEHAVSLKVRDLRVVIVRDGDLWFAQGIDIDYAASGTSVEDVKHRFAMGLFKSLIANVDLGGSIDAFLKHPPREQIEQLQNGPDSREAKLSFSTERFPRDLPIPYDRIAFVEPQAA
ncbi:MAG: hypothetical protein AB7Q81_24590 [Gammaproteobacteria bacterium]